MAPKKAPVSDEGMVEVIIAFDPDDMTRNGTTDRLPRPRAQQLVNEGRARWVNAADAAPGDSTLAPAEPPA